MGTAKVNGKRLDGEQMVDVLTAMGLDIATFGNHEFDLQEDPFRDRLREAAFTWITSNVSDASGQRFPNTLPHKTLTVTEAAGSVRIGLVGATVELGQEVVQLVPCNPGGEAPATARYYRIHDPIEAIRQQVAALGQVDVLIALTHLNLEEDMRLAEAVPQLDLILGGHEHENWQVQRGQHFTPILKADANARTVYIHTLRYHLPTRRLDVTSQLKTITADMPSDATVKARTEAWTREAFEAFRAQNLNPEDQVVKVTETLDGREASVRQGTTNLTRLIGGQRLDKSRFYRVAINDFLLSSREKGLAFLTLENPDIKKASKRIVSPDLRQMLIDELRRQYSSR